MGNLEFARDLRTNMPPAECKLWSCIRRKQMDGYRFRRQQMLGRYIVDFICLEQRLVIELDGLQHLFQKAYDARRTAWLENEGYRVLRFWNDEVFYGFEAVLERISAALEEQSTRIDCSVAC